eukprot:116409-Rhodomonas_salina.1
MLLIVLDSVESESALFSSTVLLAAFRPRHHSRAAVLVVHHVLVVVHNVLLISCVLIIVQQWSNKQLVDVGGDTAACQVVVHWQGAAVTAGLINVWLSYADDHPKLWAPKKSRHWQLHSLLELQFQSAKTHPPTYNVSQTYSFDCPSCCPTHPSGSLLLDFGGAFEAQDLTLGESSALPQTVEVST